MAAGAPASRDEVPVHGIDRESFRRAIESADAAAPAAAGPAAAVAKKGKAGADPTAQLRVKINTLKRCVAPSGTTMGATRVGLM